MTTRFDELIYSFYGFSLKKGFYIGLELEYENYPTTIDKHPHLSHWNIMPDNSLRNNGIEYVSKPLAPKAHEVAIKEMLSCAIGANVKATPRCGLHVHVNMLDRTFRDIYLVSVLYTLLEPYIFAKFAPNRATSHFCVPVSSNTSLVEILHNDNLALRMQPTKMKPKTTKKKPEPWINDLYPSLMQAHTNGVQVGDGLTHYAPVVAAGLPPQFMADINGVLYSPEIYFESPVFTSTPKYSALNYSSIKKYGTLEYRHHPSTLQEMEILTWVKFLLKLHARAYLWNDPTEILESYEQLGPLDFVKLIDLPLEAEIQSSNIDQLDIEDAIDSATLIAGHKPVNWQELKWEIN